MTATILTLIVLPALYTIIEGRPKKDQNMKNSEPALAQTILPMMLVVALSTCLFGCSMFESKANVSPTGSDAGKQTDDRGNPVAAGPNAGKDKRPGVSSTSNGIAAEDKAYSAPLLVDLTGAQEQEIGLVIAEAKHGDVLKTVESPGRVGPNSEFSRLVSTPSPGRATE